MFKVVAKDIEEEYLRWTDALNRANSLKPHCKSLFTDIRIYYAKETANTSLSNEEQKKAMLIWVYSRSHKYPQYIGAGMYDHLAKLFIAEAMAEAEATE